MGEQEYQNLTMMIAEVEQGIVYPDYMAKEICRNTEHSEGMEKRLYRAIKKFYKHALNNCEEHKFFKPCIAAEEIEDWMLKESAPADAEEAIEIAQTAHAAGYAILEYMLEIIAKSKAQEIL